MNRRGLTVAILLMTLIPACAWGLFPPPPDVEGAPPVEKRAVPSGDVLLPLYAVDTNDPEGTTTLWALRNDSLESVDVEVLYYEPDAPQAFQRRDVFTLAAKSIKTVNVRFVENLEVSPDGFARGYVIFRALTDGFDQLQGDYFLITPGENFASGFRLVNIDEGSVHNELCRSATIRFMRGGGFSGGTTYRIWFEADTPPAGSQTVVTYAVYDEPGNLLLEAELPVEDSAFDIDIATLLGPFQGLVNFGAVEFSFSGTVGSPARNRLGTVSGVLDALGSYSVGIESSCNN
ncbi:MAG: hypothetical protein AAGM22_04325 [Acidobacteriota bacterium]